MATGNKNYVSFWFWFFALFVTAIPCVGFLMVILWAFVGDNESRKNFFRAWLAWVLLFLALWGGILALGFWPEIQKFVQSWQHQIR